ncbi:MAG: TCR/Tet family MFS transporter [Proteobacteria bacterium]|nr:TCR/Tet family MFS transporter [Pseudomonadota bacterium]
MTPNQPRRGLLFVLITVLLDSIGLGIIIPVMPDLIMELTGEGVAAASLYGGWLLFTFASMQFVFSPIVGNLSDGFGRRPVLLASLAAYGFNYLVMAVAPSVGWLFLGRIVAGITGATYSTANAFIADVSASDRRAQDFGLVGAAFGSGFILGPVIGGVLGQYGSRVPFYAAAAFSLMNWLYGLLVVPETLPRERRRAFQLARANPVGALLQLGRYPRMLGLVVAVLLYQLASFVNPSTWSYFAIQKLAWSERDIGYSLGAAGLLLAFVQGYLTRIAIPRLGRRSAALVGVSFAGVGYLGFAFATQGWMMYAWLVPWSLSGLALPAIQGLMSSRVPVDAQGELQGVLSSLGGLAAVVAPPMMTRLFSYFSSAQAPVYFPGAAFAAAAALAMCGLMILAPALSRATD